MKNIDNPIIQHFKTSKGRLEHVQTIVQVCLKEPWRAHEHQVFINHAIRWAIEQPNTYDLIRVLLPVSDQAHDCRTLFKEACAHGWADVVRLIIDYVDGDVLRHNGGHAILLAAKNGNSDVLDILKDKIIGLSLPIDVMFKKAVGASMPALQSLDYLFPSVTKNIHHGLFYGAAGNNNLENLQFLIDKMSSDIKPSYHSALKEKIKLAANSAAMQGFEECLNLLIETYQSWFNTEIDYIGLATYALQHEHSHILLNLAQRSEDAQRVVVHAAGFNNDECAQVVLARMQHQILTEETQNILPASTTKLRKL